MRLLSLAVGMICLAPGCGLHAQITLEGWHTVDTGGGHSESGALSIDGTLGQPDVSQFPLCSADGGAGCVNPTWELNGGFWLEANATQPPSPSCNGEPGCIFRNGFEP